MAIMHVNFFSKCLMRSITINVILPVDKFSSSGNDLIEDKPFKTLYLLNGVYGDQNDWINGTRISSWAQNKNLAVIMPAGENHFYVDNEDRGELFGQFIGEELINISRKMFHLSTKREDTFIAGLSMGGYGALINGLRYSETFSCIAGLSSALILDEIINSNNETETLIYKRSFLTNIFGRIEKIIGSNADYKFLITKLINEKKDVPKIYLCCGTEDLLYKNNIEFCNFLKKNNVKYFWQEGSGNHNWIFWDEYIRKILEWLPLETGCDGICSSNVKL